MVLAQPVAQFGFDRAEVDLLVLEQRPENPQARMAVWVSSQRSRSALCRYPHKADYAEFGVMRTRRWMSWHAGEARPGEGGITAWWSETFEEGQERVGWLVASGGDAGRAGEREGAFLGFHVGVDVDLG